MLHLVFFLMVFFSVLNYNDHRKTIVHQVIRAIRDYIGIEPEKYLQYLMRRGIEPSPELVKQIKGKDSRYEYYDLANNLIVVCMAQVTHPDKNKLVKKFQ